MTMNCLQKSSGEVGESIRAYRVEVVVGGKAVVARPVMIVSSALLGQRMGDWAILRVCVCFAMFANLPPAEGDNR